MEKIFYLCDGERENCKKRNCYKNGGDCRHTTDISHKQLNKVREWLLYAVTKAEKELGAGTGKLKLRYVYDMFVARFEWLAKVITFDMFSMMVDEALEQMRTMLDSNEAVQKLIANEAGEGSE